jgi:nucleoside-diphosphate-sugar epimerase
MVLQMKEKGLDVYGTDSVHGVCTDEIVDIRFAEEVYKLIKKTQPDMIVPMAYTLSGGVAAEAHKTMHLNIMATDSIFDAAVAFEIPAVLFASSIAVYGDQKDFGHDNWVDEETYGRPATLYGWMKQLNEACARHYATKGQTRFITVRVSSLFGRARLGGRFNPVGEIISAPDDNSSVTIPMVSSHVTSFVHVDEVSQVFVELAAAKSPKHDIYNTGGASLTIGELSQIASQAFNRKISCDENGEDFTQVGRVKWDRFREEFGVERKTMMEHLIAEKAYLDDLRG